MNRTDETTQPPTEDTTQPPTENTTQPTTEDTTQPTTEDTTQPTTENTMQPPPGNTTQPPTESPTPEEIGSGEYCELFVERETDRLQAIARREGTNFNIAQLRDNLPEECHFLLDTVTQPTPSPPSSDTTTPHSANETTQPPPVNATQPPLRNTTQPPTESPTSNEVSSEEYCKVFVERETDRLQAIARREGTIFSIAQLRDNIPEECHLLLDAVTQPTPSPPSSDTTTPHSANETTQPPPVNATQPPLRNTTQPPTESPTSNEVSSEEYCKVFVERETDRLQAIARREGTNFSIAQLRDNIPEECHLLLDAVTQPTPSQPSSDTTTRHSASETTQPPTESPTPEEIGSGEYCALFVERETDRLQAIARREGMNFSIAQLRDNLPEECHFLLEDEEVANPTIQPTTEQPSTAESPSTEPPTVEQPVTGQSNTQASTMSPTGRRKRRAQKWSAKSFWHDVSRKARARYQSSLNPTSVRFDVEKGQMVKDELDDAIFKE